MEGTRKDILERIDKWTTDLDAPNVLWLIGHPGVGKSAIATNAVAKLRASKRLGSSFFLQRQNAAVMTPHSLWRTVAYDLAKRHPSIRKTLVAKMKTGEIIPTTTDVDTLFLHFIHEPLTKSEDIPKGELPVIVIDALDECGGLDGQHSEHRWNLIRTLKSWSSLSGKFKLIVTLRK